MSKLTAVLNVVNEFKTQRTSLTAGKRLIKSCRVLGLTDTEIMDLLQMAAYANGNRELLEGLKL